MGFAPPSGSAVVRTLEKEGVRLPFAEKLGFSNKQELNALEIVVRGVMAIQSGENPRVIEQKLNTFLPPKQRASKEAA